MVHMKQTEHRRLVLRVHRHTDTSLVLSLGRTSVRASARSIVRSRLSVQITVCVCLCLSKYCSGLTQLTACEPVSQTSERSKACTLLWMYLRMPMCACMREKYDSIATTQQWKTCYARSSQLPLPLYTAWILFCNEHCVTLAKIHERALKGKQKQTRKQSHKYITPNT